ncbi:MAG: tetracycline 7-halogenase / O2-dependent halogenase [Acidobacteriaceae bacterium]|nr:tetracycline 7-halogenase / O2-dependent halogenase [Acidobacteriaceae bacterium]
MNDAYDIAVVGSGFGGSLLAMIAHQLGRSVILLEKNKHPRFAIGESSTPLSNILLESLATHYDLQRIAPLSKWGSWQQTYPQVGCGLKRGFTFYHHVLGAPYAGDPTRQRQLLVAASPHDRIADTHWYRAEVDHLFVQEAQNIGVQYLDEVTLQSVAESENEVQLQGHRNNEDFLVRAKFVVDATGPRGFLHHALALQQSPLPGFPATQALFSHFTGVGRFADQIAGDDSEHPPYPVDDAAVHHIFDGGWIWVLQFNNGITSAGVAATDKLAGRLRISVSEGLAAWQRLLDLIPALKNQFANSQVAQPFSYLPRVSFRSNAIAGKRWALLPSAAGFVDPLLSTGFPLTLLGVARLAEIIERDWAKPEFPARLKSYASQTDNELLAAANLIAALYGAMDKFPTFASLSMLYFAAASFSESARRLGKAHLAPSFLLHDDPHFGPAVRRCLQRAQNACTQLEMDELTNAISQAIEPINVAGFGNPSRRNWYPVDANDLLHSAAKLKSTEHQISQLLERCGFWK